MGTYSNYFTIISEENPANEVHDYVAKHPTDNKPFDYMTFILNPYLGTSWVLHDLSQGISRIWHSSRREQKGTIHEQEQVILSTFQHWSIVFFLVNLCLIFGLSTKKLGFNMALYKKTLKCKAFFWCNIIKCFVEFKGTNKITW